MKAIIAMAKNRAIGLNDKLPWGTIYKEDFKWFKEFTMGKTLVVGRKTFDDLPPLKGRGIIVISNSIQNPFDFHSKNTDKFEDLYMRTVEQMNDDLKNNVWSDVIVAGGQRTYELFMPHITEFYVTHINKDYDGDVFMEPFEHNFPNQETVKEFEFGKVIKYSK